MPLVLRSLCFPPLPRRPSTVAGISAEGEEAQAEHFENWRKQSTARSRARSAKRQEFASARGTKFSLCFFSIPPIASVFAVSM